MTGKQTTVLWMGLLLVIGNLVTSPQWKTLWNGTILQGESKANQNAKNNLTLPQPLGNPGGGGSWWFPYMNLGTQAASPASQLSA